VTYAADNDELTTQQPLRSKLKTHQIDAANDNGTTAVADGEKIV
jgi:hypothetical protein